MGGTRFEKYWEKNKKARERGGKERSEESEKQRKSQMTDRCRWTREGTRAYIKENGKLRTHLPKDIRRMTKEKKKKS